MKVLARLEDGRRRIVNIKTLDRFTDRDVLSLRKQICLNSLYLSDYYNSFGVDTLTVSNIFDSYCEYLYSLAEEAGDETRNEYFDFCKYDTDQNLLDFWHNDLCLEGLEPVYTREIYSGWDRIYLSFTNEDIQKQKIA